MEDESRAQALASEMTDHWITVTLSDGEGPGQVDFRVNASEGFEADPSVHALGAIAVRALERRRIDPRLAGYDPERKGTAMLTIERTGGADVNIGVLCEPAVTVRTGELSAAQAMLLTMVRDIEQQLGAAGANFDVRSESEGE